MSAYRISIYKEIHDEAKLAAGGTFIGRGLPEQTYESGELTRTVLIEFADGHAARTAHDGSAYEEAPGALGGGAVRDLRIVPGV